MSCNCKHSCNCVDPCSDTQIRRIVDDAVADRVEDMEGIASDAQHSAEDSATSASQSAQSAAQSQQFATTAGNNATSAAQSAQQAAVSATAAAESATAAVQVTTGLKQVADELTDTASRLSDKVDGANQAAEDAIQAKTEAQASALTASQAASTASTASTSAAGSATLAQASATNAQGFANTAQQAAVETVEAAAGVKDKLDDWAIQYPSAVQQMNDAVASTSADAATASAAATSATASEASAKLSADQATAIATTLNSGLQGYADEATLLAAVPSAVQLAVTMDTNKLFYWNGTAWQDLQLTLDNWVKDIGNLDKALNGTSVTWIDTAGVTRKSMAALDTVINSLDVDGNFTFADTASGLAAVAELGYFRTISTDENNEIAFTYWQKVGGVAVKKTTLSSGTATDNLNEKIATVDDRTKGIQSQNFSTDPFEIVDELNKLMLALSKEALLKAPGGISTTNIAANKLTVSELAGIVSLALASLTANRLVSNTTTGEYAYVEEDANGNALWGTLTDGTKKYLNQPLHNRAGLSYGDFYAIGDSITANGVTFFDSTRKYESFNDLSWHVWGMLLSMGRLRFTGASATGGYTSAQILSQHLPNALKSGASYCVVMAGRNDVVQGLNVNTVTIPNMKEIFRQLKAKGIIPVVCTMSAHGNSVSNANRLAEHTVNAWLRQYARKNKLPLVDLHKATVNPLTGDWKPGYNQDVSHPTNVGAYYMGKALKDGMLEWAANVLPPMADEQLPINTLGMNVFDNALFLNTDDINPSNWTIVNPGVSTVTDADPADTAVVGKIWESQNQTATYTVNVTPGQKLGFGFKVKTSGVGNFSFSCAGAAGSGLTNLAGLRDWKSQIPDWGYFYYEFVVPADQTSITFTLITGAAKVSLAQLALIQIPEV